MGNNVSEKEKARELIPLDSRSFTRCSRITEIYENCIPFASLEEIAHYSPITLHEVEDRFEKVTVPGTMSIGGIAIILELFCLCEKQTPDAHQFKMALLWTKECVLGQRDFKNLLNLVIRHREY